MGVSKNTGTLKSSILIGLSIINHPFWGTTIFGNTHMTTVCRWPLPPGLQTWSGHAVSSSAWTQNGGHLGKNPRDLHFKMNRYYVSFVSFMYLYKHYLCISYVFVCVYGVCLIVSESIWCMMQKQIEYAFLVRFVYHWSALEHLIRTWPFFASWTPYLDKFDPYQTTFLKVRVVWRGHDSPTSFQSLQRPFCFSLPSAWKDANQAKLLRSGDRVDCLQPIRSVETGIALHENDIIYFRMNHL